MRIDVILPCLNEAEALPWVLSRMPAGFHPIVADNGSTDASASIAAEYGATVIQVPQRGFGAACHAGLGAGPPRGANKVPAVELRRRPGVRLRDLGPMRCARRAPLLGLGLSDRRFGYPLEMVMAAANADWRIDEVDIPYLPRSGRSKATRTESG